MLKSQDFLVLIKLIGLHRAFLRKVHYPTSSRKKLFDGDNEYMENDNYLNFNEIFSDNAGPENPVGIPISNPSNFGG